MSALLERLERQATILDSPAQRVRCEATLLDIDELAAHEHRRWKSMQEELRRAGDPTAGEDKYYVDSLIPFNSADFATVTLATTSKEMWPTALWTATPSGSKYWWVGKTLKIHAFGKITTAATPGNLTVEVRYGTGDAGGTLLATSAAQTLIAAQTSISWDIYFSVECRAIGTGTNGSLFAWGKAFFGTAVIAVGDFLIPASAAAAVGVDTTAASGISLQFKRSGSTVETATVQDMQYMSRN